MDRSYSDGHDATPSTRSYSNFFHPSPPLLPCVQGVVTAATGAGLTIVLRRAFTGNTGMSTSSAILQASDSPTVAAATTVPPPLPAPAPPPPPPQPDGKPAHDVVAGAVARAASQSTIHPLDTMKVRMQAGGGRATAPAPTPPPSTTPAPARFSTSKSAGLPPSSLNHPNDRMIRLERGLSEVKGLYKGVVGAATGAGLIIGTYFAFYSTTKRFLRERTDMHEGASAFVAGAVAALGSSVVKVPLAVCIRSVQAGVYQNVFHAAKSIVSAAGVRGLFTGFVPTILEDVPDMAVKFAVYESLRKLHDQMKNGRSASVLEDLIMGGVAGAAAAAATTPLDVVKTVMMCTASSRPTLAGAARSIMCEGKGVKPFFRGVGPRALSNGLNSAIFFCFFEAIRQVLIKKQEKAAALAAAGGIHAHTQQKTPITSGSRIEALKEKTEALIKRGTRAAIERQQRLLEAPALRPAGSAAACLSLALPVPEWKDE